MFSFTYIVADVVTDHCSNRIDFNLSPGRHQPCPPGSASPATAESDGCHLGTLGGTDSGMVTANHRVTLRPYNHKLSRVHSRVLLVGTGRSFARATRTLWEIYWHQVAEATQPNRLDAVDLPFFDNLDSALWNLSSDLQGPNHNLTETGPSGMWYPSACHRLREEGDFG